MRIPGSISSSMIDDASLTRRMALSISFRSLSEDLEGGFTMAFLEWFTLKIINYINNK